jgi:hypothetical protein
MQHVEILLARLTVRNLGPRGEEMNGGAIFPEKSIHRLKVVFPISTIVSY